jgi:CRP-like cAMP-binding protein
LTGERFADSELEVVRPSFTQETLIRVVGPGNFTGEINTLSGRRAFARVRAHQDSKVIEIDRESLLALVPTDAELSEMVRSHTNRSWMAGNACVRLRNPSGSIG